MAHIRLDPAVAADLCTRHGIRELAFFGSATREDFRPESDIDVLIEFEQGTRIGFFELMEIQDELSALLGRKVDLVTKGMLSRFFRDEVLAGREVIYVTSQ